MNPLHPDSDGDGLPDGAELAEDLSLFQYSYTLSVTRDFTTTPRSPDLMDATVSMSWFHTGPSTWNGSGTCVECYAPDPPPPPDALASEGEDRQWPGSGQGTSTNWITRLNNPAKVYDGPYPIAAPNVPWEKCAGYSLTMAPPAYDPTFAGTYTRSASTIAHLKSNAPLWSKPKRSVVLSCVAVDKTDGSDLDPDITGFNLGEPVQGPGGVDITPATTAVTIAGQQCDASGTVLLEINKVEEKDVTPQIGVQWYSYGLGAQRPKAVTLTWAYHPDIIGGLPDLQAAFDGGARLLATDNDGPGDGGVADDVSCYVEFFILPSISRLFTGPHTAPHYNLIERAEDLHSRA